MDDYQKIEQAIRDICHSMAMYTMTSERQYQISKTLGEVVLPHLIDLHKVIRGRVEVAKRQAVSADEEREYLDAVTNGEEDWA